MELSPLPKKRGNAFLVWALAVSAGVHLFFGVIYPYANARISEQETEKVTLTKKTKVVVPTPRPTIPPTPPPKSTPPPQTPKLKLNVVKTTSNTGSGPGPVEKKYVPPPVGVPEGQPTGFSTAAPAPTSGPATAAPTVPPPTPTPHPACAVPNKDATMTRAVEPDFPDIARQQGAVGVAQIKVTLSASGAVEGVTVYKSAGNAALDQSALAAARASSYAPEVDNCGPVGGSYLFRADFTGQ